MPKNMANYLTIGRVLMIPVFLVLMYVDFPGSRYWALAVYIVACLTDFADGLENFAVALAYGWMWLLIMVVVVVVVVRVLRKRRRKAKKADDKPEKP